MLKKFPVHRIEDLIIAREDSMNHFALTIIGVITSYSIHYTKLYEIRWRQAHVARLAARCLIQGNN